MGGVGTCFFAGIWPCISYLHDRKDGPKLLGNAPSTLVEQALVMMSRHISGCTENVEEKEQCFASVFELNMGEKWYIDLLNITNFFWW